MSSRTAEALALALLLGILVLLVGALFWQREPPRYAPTKGRQADYDHFMRVCVAQRAATSGHMRTCNKAAAELGLAAPMKGDTSNE